MVTRLHARDLAFLRGIPVDPAALERRKHVLNSPVHLAPLRQPPHSHNWSLSTKIVQQFTSLFTLGGFVTSARAAVSVVATVPDIFSTKTEKFFDFF
jgi:hypothetical protein